MKCGSYQTGMTDFRFTGKQFKEMGWDGNLNTLEDFKKEVKWALENGWDPNEMSFQEFLSRWNDIVNSIINTEESEEDEDDLDDEDDKEENIDERRRKAEEAGWDEEEMSLEEFEDYFNR